MADNKPKRTNDDSPQARQRKNDPRSAARVRQSDLASDIQGRNKLQGNDQRSVPNQRREQPKVAGAGGRPGPQAEQEGGKNEAEG